MPCHTSTGCRTMLSFSSDFKRLLPEGNILLPGGKTVYPLIKMSSPKATFCFPEAKFRIAEANVCSPKQNVASGKQHVEIAEAPGSPRKVPGGPRKAPGRPRERQYSPGLGFRQGLPDPGPVLSKGPVQHGPGPVLVCGFGRPRFRAQGSPRSPLRALRAPGRYFWGSGDPTV